MSFVNNDFANNALDRKSCIGFIIIYEIYWVLSNLLLFIMINKVLKNSHLTCVSIRDPNKIDIDIDWRSESVVLKEPIYQQFYFCNTYCAIGCVPPNYMLQLD